MKFKNGTMMIFTSILIASGLVQTAATRLLAGECADGFWTGFVTALCWGDAGANGAERCPLGDCTALMRR
jgi:hypothetical protein